MSKFRKNSSHFQSKDNVKFAVKTVRIGSNGNVDISTEGNIFNFLAQLLRSPVQYRST
jgi:hypothetical protein